MQIQIPDAQSVNLKKIGKALEVDVKSMPETSLAHIFNYGLRQLLNDAMASAGDDAVKAETQARERLANLMSGTLRASRESDPVAAEVKRILAREVQDRLIQHFGSAKKVTEAEEADMFTRADIAKDYLGENRDRIMGEAKRRVDEAKKVNVKVDLSKFIKK